MEYHKTINEILKLLDTQIEIVKVGDLLETYKTQFIIKKNNAYKHYFFISTCESFMTGLYSILFPQQGQNSIG